MVPRALAQSHSNPRVLHSCMSPPRPAPPNPPPAGPTSGGGSLRLFLPGQHLSVCASLSNPLAWGSPFTLHPQLRNEFSSSPQNAQDCSYNRCFSPSLLQGSEAGPVGQDQRGQLGNLLFPPQLEGLIWWSSMWGTDWTFSEPF